MLTDSQRALLIRLLNDRSDVLAAHSRVIAEYDAAKARGENPSGIFLDEPKLRQEIKDVADTLDMLYKREM